MIPAPKPFQPPAVRPAIVPPLILVKLLLLTVAAARADDRTDFFERRIRPILVEQCYECHAADSKDLGGKLRMDSREGMLEGGESGPVLVAGQPQASLLIQALRYDGLEMPPDGPLPESVVKDFEKWISSGAADPRTRQSSAQNGNPSAIGSATLWSFQPRRTPTIPAVRDQQWPRSPIDHFVLGRLEQHQLTPTRDAPPETLIRRLYQDLLGLPPTLEQVEQFVSDHLRDPNRATEHLVDRLLTSPDFGVRWGRHWLDVARYGESNGDDGLGRNASFPHAWRYRDYVIDAVNHDVPYDQFLIEQIAGDLLPFDTAGQRNRNLVATGFLAIGSKPASAMNKDFAMDVVDDQINVVCKSVMGISVACARCHDHKHDPIPTKDYYALAGIFSSTETLYGAAGNEKLTAPPTPLHELRLSFPSDAKLPDRTPTPQFPQDYADQIGQLKPSFQASLKEASERFTVKPAAKYSSETFATVQDLTISGNLDEAVESYSVAFWFRNRLENKERPITAYLFSRAKLGDKSLPGDHLGIGGNHESNNAGKLFVFNGNQKKQSLRGSTIIARDSWNHVALVRDGENVRVYLNGQLEIEGVLPATFADSKEFCLANRSDNFAPLNGNLGHVAVFDRPLSETHALELHQVSGQPLGVKPSPVEGYAMGVRDRAKPADCKLHINGQGSKLGAVIPRGLLTAYQTRSENDPTSAFQLTTKQFEIGDQQSGRLQLARWLTHPHHPQTARVMANRIWLHLFGRGLVTTPDDFGVYGAEPTHPELLDHLANRFVERGWSIKRLIREIVLSRTYQLDSLCEEDSRKADPENVWMARHLRRRMDAESLRDSMLLACGLMDRSPADGSAIDQTDILINWPPGESTDLHRESYHRSIYLCLLRHSPPKELAAFDLPDGVSVVGQREVTTLPTQSLFLLNSDFVVRQSESFATRLLAQANPDLKESASEDLSLNNERESLRELYSSVLQRLPSESEMMRSLEYLERTDDALGTIVTDPQRRRLRTWASLCQALLMTNEFRYVD